MFNFKFNVPHDILIVCLLEMNFTDLKRNEGNTWPWECVRVSTLCSVSTGEGEHSLQC